MWTVRPERVAGAGGSSQDTEELAGQRPPGPGSQWLACPRQRVPCSQRVSLLRMEGSPPEGRSAQMPAGRATGACPSPAEPASAALGG